MKSNFKNLIKYIVRGGVVNVSITQSAFETKPFLGKGVLITGGSSGIGKIVARKFLLMGAEVIITGTNKNKLIKASEELKSYGTIQYLQWDISTISRMKSKLEEACSLFSSNANLSILINNAGIYSEVRFFDITEEQFDRLMDTNLKGMYFISQEFLRYKVSNKETGKIINIASNRALYGDISPYGLSKRAVVSLTEGMAKDFISYGIIVNGIAPGMTASNINNIDAMENAYAGGERSKRVVLPEEVAELAVWLASDLSNSVVGQTIVIDGGTSLR